MPEPMPEIAVGDWMLFDDGRLIYAEREVPLMDGLARRFPVRATTSIREIRKANGVVWRREEPK
jgi:hypothetical protein